jgi:raffinose/stachyose/melibiose transport system permease protein/N-acetylglucosamine transport system permease protein
MIVPIVGALPAYYKLLSDLHFVNNIFGMILTFGSGFGIYFLFLYGFFKSISWEYAEAAFVDGASDYMVFFKIMLPQAKPALVSVGIICAIGIWNDYFTPFMFLDQFPTVSLGIYQFETLMIYQSNYPVYFAAILLSSVPMIIIYTLFQKTILENTVAGGLKG